MTRNGAGLLIFTWQRPSWRRLIRHMVSKYRAFFCRCKQRLTFTHDLNQASKEEARLDKVELHGASITISGVINVLTVNRIIMENTLYKISMHSIVVKKMNIHRECSCVHRVEDQSLDHLSRTEGSPSGSYKSRAL